jgi:hypothetical protein
LEYCASFLETPLLTLIGSRLSAEAIPVNSGKQIKITISLANNLLKSVAPLSPSGKGLTKNKKGSLTLMKQPFLIGSDQSFIQQ